MANFGIFETLLSRGGLESLRIILRRHIEISFLQRRNIRKIQSTVLAMFQATDQKIGGARGVLSIPKDCPILMNRKVTRARKIGNDIHYTVVLRFARVTCPIGVPGIEGKEPEVIAVAVAAQLLQTAS